MPQQQYELAGLTVLHVTQPAEGGVARVVMDLVRAQVGAGARVVVACPPDAPGALGHPGAGHPGLAADASGTPPADQSHADRSPADRSRTDRSRTSGSHTSLPYASRLAQAVAEAGAEAVRWPARRSPGPGLVREVRAAARVIRAVRPDLLHLHSAKAGLAGRLAARGRVPTVFQPHAWSYEAVTGPTARAALRWERYAAAHWTDRLLCVSEAERAAGERAGVEARWAVVPNGVDTGRFTPPVPPASRATVRAALPALSGLGPDGLRPDGLGPDGLRPDDPLVVCVGRLCPQKGQDALLRAWALVAAELPGARLVLVGDGPDRARLLREAPPGVTLAGSAADPLPWFQAADVVVQPSRWEGMALAPLEAMACGRPVVRTEVAGARESVPPADADGCLVPVGDEHALAAALLRLLADPDLRTAAGQRALAHVRDHHDVRRAADAVSALYRDLLALPRPRSQPHPPVVERATR